MVVLSGTVVLIAALAYHLLNPPCPAPASGAIVLLVVALLLLLAAMATIRRAAPARPATR